MSESELTLGPYAMLRKIGAGGMGEVWLARDPRLERQVALKLLPPALRDDPERRQRLLREARAAAKLSHPNITAIHEVGEAEGRDYIAFEYVEGQTLEELVRERRLPLAELIDLALQLADALAYAHERGVIHRDLKASNVIVTPRGHPKLLDFGLAKLLGEEGASSARKDTTLTTAGVIFGTPQAMSPEQALGRPVDQRSDVFSFGSLLYEMACGQPAFRGGTVMEVMDAVIHAEPAEILRLRPDLPAELAGIVSRAMRKDPAERYPSFAGLVADLKHFKRRSESGLAPVARARRPLAPAVLVGVLGLGAALAWMLLGRGAHEPDRVPEGTPKGSIAVIGFELDGDSPWTPDGPGLERVLTSLVTTALAEAGGIDVASGSKVAACVRQAGPPDGGALDAAHAVEAARLAGVDLVLAGRVLARGERLSSTAELVDVASGKRLTALRREAESGQGLFALAAGLATDVRACLGLTRPGAPGIDLATERTDVPEAYRALVAGEQAIEEGRLTEACRHLERATGVDPAFAFAHARLGLAREWEGDLDGAVRAYQTALAHTERLPERWERLVRAAALRHEGDTPRAFAELTTLIDAGNAMPEAYSTLGELLTHDSRREDPLGAREAFLHALDLDPNLRLVLRPIVHHTLVLGDTRVLVDLLKRLRWQKAPPAGIAAVELGLDLARRDAAAVAARIEAAGREADDLEEYRWSLVALGRLDDLGTVLAARIPSSDSPGRFEQLDYEADLALRRGRLREAVRLDLEACACLGAPERVPRFSSRPTWTLLEAARTKLLLGEPLDEVCTLVERALELDPFGLRPLFWKIRWLAEAGRLAEAEAERKRMLGLAAQASGPVAQSWLRLASTLVSLAKGDLARARTDLAIPPPPGTASWTHLQLVHAWVAHAAGEVDAEVAAWQRALEAARGPTEVEHDLELHALYGLADAEERAGRSTEARTHGRELLSAWGASTEPGVALLEDARRRWGP